MFKWIHGIRMHLRFKRLKRRPRFNIMRTSGCWDCPEREWRKYGACDGCPRLGHWTDWFILWPEQPE